MFRFVFMLGALSFCTSAAFGQEKATPAVEKVRLERAIYHVRHGAAVNLAEVLNKHFKEEGAFQAVPEATSNVLLLSGSRESLEQAQAVLARLDRAPRQIVLKIWIAEMAPPGKGVEVPAKSLEGPVEEVKKRLEELHRAGHITTLRRYELKASENQPATIHHGEQKVIPIGGGGGGFPKGGRGLTLDRRDFGIMIAATPRIPPDGAVTMELKIEESRPHTSEDGPVLGADDAGAPIRAGETATTRVNSTLSVRSGDAAPIEGVVTRSRAGTGQTLIVVAARIEEATRGK